MTKIFTENDLVRFIYEETSEAENNEIRDALMCNPGLQEMYNELKDMKSMLDENLMKPGKQAVNNILNYSKKFTDLSVIK
ncbi:MAG: hypothetical protein NXI20_02330 [bacterium]|nr:hypothetical protein [bacterium]